MIGAAEPGAQRRCDRYEREALELIEAGQPLPEHFSTCPDCLAAAAAYRRLRSDLSALDTETAPGPDWKSRVRERIAEGEGNSTVGRRVAAALALAAGLLVIVLLVRPDPGPIDETLTVEVSRPQDAAVLRGSEAQPGDRLRVTATVDPERVVELRLYRDDRDLLVRCTDQPPCVREGDTIRLEIPLETVGRYQTILLTSSPGDSLPDPAGALDADVERAAEAGAELVVGEQVRVR